VPCPAFSSNHRPADEEFSDGHDALALHARTREMFGEAGDAESSDGDAAGRRRADRKSSVVLLYA
jgi:hypothetical protein